MKIILLNLIVGLASGQVLAYLPPTPYPGAVGSDNTTAIHMSSNAIVSWADGYTNMVYGIDVGETWKTPEKALGMAVGNSFDVVSLGRGGHITLTFSEGISDRGGFDFAVFENAVNDTFLELAWVEVSSDGTTFTRFPNFSLTGGSVGAFGSVSPTALHGYGGKYRQGYGTPFDLSELHIVKNAIDVGAHNFTTAYITSFTNTYAALDFDSVQFIRLVDVVGDGNDLDVEGYAIYDPYSTFDSVGFDLEAVGVINSATVDGPIISVGMTNDLMVLEYAFDYMILSNDVVMTSTNLLSWIPAIPSAISQETNGAIIMKSATMIIDEINRFYRLEFDEL